MRPLDLCVSPCSFRCMGRLCEAVCQNPIASALMAIPIVGLAFRFGPSLALLKTKFTLLTAGIALVAIIALIGIRYFCSRNSSSERSPLLSNGSPSLRASANTTSDRQLFEKIIGAVSQAKDGHIDDVFGDFAHFKLKNSIEQVGIYRGQDAQGRQFIFVKGWCENSSSDFGNYNWSMLIYLDEKNALTQKAMWTGEFQDLFDNDHIMDTLQRLLRDKKVEVTNSFGQRITIGVTVEDTSL